MIKLIVCRDNGELEAEPDNQEGAVFFHPIPKSLVDKVREGDVWDGRLGRLWDSAKVDRNGKKIFIRYFIPESLITTGGVDNGN